MAVTYPRQYLCKLQILPMIERVAFVGAEQAEGTLKRLQLTGLQTISVPAIEALVTAVKECELSVSNTLVVGGQLPGAVSWTDTSDQVSQFPSCDQLMQFIVQHNRRNILDRQPQHLQCSATAEPNCAASKSANSRLTEAQQQHNTQLPQPPPVLVVGYVMKASREAQLASAGLLHILPVDGICFMPLNVDSLNESEPQQQCHIDILLHKGSDELVTAADGSVAWSASLKRLQEWTLARPHICVVDPFQNTAKVLDRLVLGQLLSQLQHLKLPCGVVARSPRYCQVDSFNSDDLQHTLAQAGMVAPFIVKPVVACGVQHSHSMALVLQPAALAHLQGQLPLPAVIQEFVNHGGTQWKVYVLGEKVFVTARASIPDVQCSPEVPPEQQLLLFDSLSSLPTQLPPHMTRHSQSTASEGINNMTQPEQQQQQQQPDQHAVEAIAAFLRSNLGLTLFGFDIVVACTEQNCVGICAADEPVSQELVVIDINYFPNYKGGSNTPELFRKALKQRWQQHIVALSEQHIESS